MNEDAIKAFSYQKMYPAENISIHYLNLNRIRPEFFRRKNGENGLDSLVLVRFK